MDALTLDFSFGPSRPTRPQRLFILFLMSVQCVMFQVKEKNLTTQNTSDNKSM